MFSFLIQFEHVILKGVVVVPLEGLIEQVPFEGFGFIAKFNALELVTFESNV